MRLVPRPHVLGIDDGPFTKGQAEPVPLVAVMTEGATLVEGVAFGAFPVDGAGATEHLVAWIGEMRWSASVQVVMLGGITLAGLGLVDIVELSARLHRPVVSVTRLDTSTSDLNEALRAAGYPERLEVALRSPACVRVNDRLFMAHAGCTQDEALHFVKASRDKSLYPESLRIAHLIATALVRGQSRGRV